VPLPDAAARTAFFAGVLARPELGAALSSADVQQLVGATAGYSGSDLADVCRTAALQPVRDLLRQQRAGCKRRRRDGSSAALLCDDAGSGGALSAAQQKGQGQGQGQTAGSRPEGVAAEGTQVQDQVPAATRGAELRRLVLADFQAALAVVKPAAVDAGIGG
jgi:SpoVK/Ycf46/Vps4 family AAA+-type ATPase